MIRDGVACGVIMGSDLIRPDDCNDPVSADDWFWSSGEELFSLRFIYCDVVWSAPSPFIDDIGWIGTKEDDALTPSVIQRTEHNELQSDSQNHGIRL